MKYNKFFFIVILSLAAMLFVFFIAIQNDAKVDLNLKNNIKQDYHFEKKYTDIYASVIPILIQTVPREENIMLGIDTGINKINFGIVNVRTPVRKKLDFTNNKEIPVKIILKTKGNITQYIKLRKTEFIIEPNSTKEEIINFTGCPVPANLTGILIVKMIVPKYSSLLWIY